MKDIDIIILNNMVEGKSANEIAALVFLSRRGVEARIKSLRKKFYCANRVQLVYKVFVEYKLINHEISEN